MAPWSSYGAIQISKRDPKLSWKDNIYTILGPNLHCRCWDKSVSSPILSGCMCSSSIAPSQSFQRLSLHRMRHFLFFFFKSPSTSAVRENAATLFCFEAPERKLHVTFHRQGGSTFSYLGGLVMTCRREYKIQARIRLFHCFKSPQTNCNN